MKQILILLSFFFSQGLWAHCPIPVVDKAGDYCMDVEWQMGDRKVKGVAQTSDQMSPYLNRVGDVPQKWIYSKAILKLWANGDKNHVPVYLSDFRVFPYMLMVDGMDHIGLYEFTYDSINQYYVLSGFNLQEMAGCWSLHWTTAVDDAAVTSTLASAITNYSNLNVADNLKATNYCGANPPPMDMGSHHH
jgi:hypothetical protein